MIINALILCAVPIKKAGYHFRITLELAPFNPDIEEKRDLSA